MASRPLRILWIELQTISRHVVVVYIKMSWNTPRTKMSILFIWGQCYRPWRNINYIANTRSMRIVRKQRYFWNIWFQTKSLRLICKRVKAVTKCSRRINALRLETVWVSRELSRSGRIWQILFSLTNLLKKAIKLARRLNWWLMPPNNSSLMRRIT